MMKDELGFSKKEIRSMNLKDEIDLISKMKQKFKLKRETDAAVKIQKVARGFFARIIVIPLL